MNREILLIALPAIVTNVTIPLLGLLDTAIAGHLGGKGALYISAVAVGAMMFNLIYWNFGFLRMGTSGLTAQAFGRSDMREAVGVLQRASSLAVVIALVILVLQWPLQWLVLLVIGPSEEVRQLALTYFYIGVWGAPPTLIMMAIKGWMLGMQDSRSPMVISIGVNVLNIVLSLVAVFVLKMGFVGIILGTVVSEWVGLAYSLWLLRHKYAEQMALVDFRAFFRFGGMKRFYQVNASIMLRSMLMMLQSLFFTAVGAREGDMMLAVNTLILQLFLLFSYFMDGFAFAGEAVVGKYCGKGDDASQSDCVRHLFYWGAAITLVCAALYAAFPQQIFALLTDDGSVVTAAMAFRWWCVAVPVAGVAAFVWDGVFVGLTRARSMFEAVAIAFALFFLTYFLMPSSLGNHGLWLAYVIFLATRSLVQTFQWNTKKA